MTAALPADGTSERFEELCNAVQMVPTAESGANRGRAQLGTNHELAKWMELGFVDFAEVYRGRGEATI